MSTFTTIAAGRRDVDSPVDEDLIDDVIENTEHNHEHAVRSGTYTTGARTAMARGRKAFSITTSSSDGNATVAITFATDSDDGDPNFLSGGKIRFTFSLEESTSSTVDWSDATYGLQTGFVVAYIEEGTLVYTGVTVRVFLTSVKSADTYSGYINWIAIGDPDTGE